MLLDALLHIKNEIDPTLAFRRSCREGQEFWIGVSERGFRSPTNTKTFCADRYLWFVRDECGRDKHSGVRASNPIAITR
jgi:hypothetical protein